MDGASGRIGGISVGEGKRKQMSSRLTKLFRMEASVPSAAEKKDCKTSALDGNGFSELPKKPSPSSLARGKSLSCLQALRDRAITYRFNPVYYPGPQTLISEYAARDEVLEPGITFPRAWCRPLLIYGPVRRLYGQCGVYNRLRCCCHLSHAHLEDAAIKPLSVLYPCPPLFIPNSFLSIREHG
ncbi:hypothetical protein DPX16_4589 [Anabarilius grahami]|uniref:Uncharacterized protein n=1 Tax=Anabarilius grahami TaxID=495550 RepID=A0A3N0YBX9_ANAGA|nr:hypothetical protein DPX16_4589 [Anabarilius grahami]